MTERYITISTKCFHLSINVGVIETWKKHRQVEKDMHEAFGVVIGSQTIELNSVVVEEITTPKPKDRHARRSFSLVDSGHQKIVDAAFKQSNGLLGYLGTWHTHPENNPSPSAIDIDDWHQCIQRNPDRKLLFFIIGIEQTKIYSLNENRFQELAAISL